ncbi:MAG TPA: hypothetical protein VFU05_01960, partial [Cyclobacteriaceae bacterium]|nr:hypothetical protein [Cyclobacteriaceae bacterium]
IWFDQIASPVNAAIVNGPEYRIPVMGTQSHPFFRSQESDRTYIHYDNDLYRNVDLLYDAFGDVLVYKFISPDKVLFIKLDSRMVQDFSLHQHYFKKYNEGIRAGIGAYFDVLFEKDDFAVVVKRRKVERLEGKLSVYIEDDVHYILNNGQWIRITGNGSFSKTLPKDQRKELTTFLKGNHINVRKRKDDDLKKVGAFCYSLKERK